MENFCKCVPLVAVVGFPAWAYAASASGTYTLSAHWDALFFLALGSLIIWREIRVAKREQSKYSVVRAYGDRY